MFDSTNDLAAKLAATGYFIDPVMTQVVFLAAKLQKPLLLEGPAGSGKTQLAIAVAAAAGSLLFEDVELAAYGAVSSSGGETLPLDELKRRFDTLGPMLEDALKRTSPKQLSASAPFSSTGNPNETVGTLLASIAFHEAYHLGQTGLSRRLLGKLGALLAPGETGHSPDGA